MRLNLVIFITCCSLLLQSTTSSTITIGGDNDNDQSISPKTTKKTIKSASINNIDDVAPVLSTHHTVEAVTPSLSDLIQSSQTTPETVLSKDSQNECKEDIKPSPASPSSSETKSTSGLMRFFETVSEFLEREDADVTDIFEYYLANKVLLFLFMFLLGRTLLHRLRINFKDSTVWKVALVPLLTPVLVYCSFIYLLSKTMAEVSSFGILLGIFSQLHANSSTTTVSKGFKLIVKSTSTNLLCTLFFDDVSATVQDARDAIAEKLEVYPSIRVCIESGRGHYVDSMSSPLLPLLQNVYSSTDIFSTVTATVRITINEVIESETKERPLEKTQSTFFNMLNSKEHIRYATDLQLHAKVMSSAIDLVTFSISCTNSFASCAPNHIFPMPNNGATIRLHPWSDDWESSSVAESKIDQHPTTVMRANSKDKNAILKSLVKDNDEVMLECDGKYMSVAKGWWLAWSSTKPRRSGAFKIEIVEKAGTNIIQETISNGISKLKDTIKESAFGKPIGSESGASKSGVLSSGDSFRLRSVKFPEYELGVTSVKIKEDFCYLGLRKITNKSSMDNEWSMGVRFTAKPNGLLALTLPSIPNLT